MKKYFLVLLAVTVLFGCSLQNDAQDVEQSEEVVAEVANEVVESEYVPSKDALMGLETLQNDLGVSLLRGDAELAPTYEEYLIAVQGLLYQFDAVVADFRSTLDEAAETPAEIAELERIQADLQAAFAEADAASQDESGYADFLGRVSEINQDLVQVFEQFLKLNTAV